MLKAVIFDLDGVIINSEPIHAEVETELLKELGVEFSKEEYYSFVGSTAADMWNKLKAQYNLEKSTQELINLDRERYITYVKNNNIEPSMGVLKFIQELHENKLKLALATSTSRKIADTVLNKFEIKRYFDVIVTGDDINTGKSTPEIFLYAAKKLRVDTEECIVIEDSCSGVNSAAGANMKCIGVDRYKDSKQDLSRCHKIIKDFSHIDFERFRMLCK